MFSTSQSGGILTDEERGRPTAKSPLVSHIANTPGDLIGQAAEGYFGRKT